MNRGRLPLAVAAIVEVTTGLALLACPTIVVELLFGTAVSGVGVVVSRVGGLGLVALGIACWPATKARALTGMLTYSTLATIYLLSLALAATFRGPLLWPAVAAHVLLTVLLVAEWQHARTLARRGTS